MGPTETFNRIIEMAEEMADQGDTSTEVYLLRAAASLRQRIGQWDERMAER